jgi:hypothetical protein
MKNILLVTLICCVLASASAKSLFEDLKTGAQMDRLSITTDEINEWIDAFLEGARINNYVTDSTVCVEATQNMTANYVFSISAAMGGLSLENYFAITKAVSSMQPWMKTCYDVSDVAIETFTQHFA